MADKQFKLLDEEALYDGFYHMRRYTLQHTLFKGGWGKTITREVFHRGNSVAVILYDPHQDKVVMIEQIRAGALTQPIPEKAWLMEIVAGSIEEGETAEDVACRETYEEAGCHIRKEDLIKVNQFYPSPGAMSEVVNLYCARIDAREVGGIYGLEEEGEDIRAHVFPFNEVYEMLQTGQINSAFTIVAIQWLYIHRDELRKKWL